MSPRQYKRDGGELTITLPEPLAAGTPFTAHDRLQRDPEPVASRTDLPFKLGWLTGKDASFVVSEPDAASSWYPVNDHPRDKATYTFRVTVPKPYMAVANGILKEHDGAGRQHDLPLGGERPDGQLPGTVAIGKFEVSETPGPAGSPCAPTTRRPRPKGSAAAFGTQADALAAISARSSGRTRSNRTASSSWTRTSAARSETQTLPIFGRRLPVAKRRDRIHGDRRAGASVVRRQRQPGKLAGCLAERGLRGVCDLAVG